MVPSDTPANLPASEDVVLEIVDALASRGLEYDEYQLHDVLDVEALARLRASSTGHVEVRFSVEGVPLLVTPAGVEVRDGTSS